MYWRYSANSTLKPLNGLRWRPERNPSTIVRALSSSVPRRATTAGSRNGRSWAAHGVIAEGGLRNADSLTIVDWRLERTADRDSGNPAIHNQSAIRNPQSAFTASRLRGLERSPPAGR